LIQRDQRLPAKNTAATNPAYIAPCAPMYCEPAPDFVAVAAASWLEDDDGPAAVTVAFTVVPVVEFPYTPVAEIVAECEDEVEVIVEFADELADAELEGVGSGIPLYKRA
jgi:hypothetical protein